MGAKVTIVYRFLPQYRVDFFERLRATLAEDDIGLTLVYGKNKEVPKKDEVDLPWAIAVSNRTINVRGKSLLWQSVPESAFNADLVIMLQENLILSNYWILAKCRRRGIKTGFWGHGINFQSERNSLGNRLKRHTALLVDWWFAYTGGVAEIVAGMGYPQSRITAVQNAIDTEDLVLAKSQVTQSELRNLRASLGIGSGPVGLYCGGMYAEKRLDFLLAACAAIRESVPGFEVIFPGAGPDAEKVKAAAKQNKWMHSVGPKFGRDRVPYFLISDAFLMPGAVGLSVLDCFALEVPMITTRDPYHGPEIEYLDDGVNGVVTDNSMDAYVGAVVRILQDEKYRAMVKKNCYGSALKYTLSAMVENFACGIYQALGDALGSRGDLYELAKAPAVERDEVEVLTPR